MANKKQREPLPLETRIEQAKQITSELSCAMNEVLSLQAMEQLINDSDELHALFRQTYEGHGLSTIHSALLRQLLIVLAQIWDYANPDKGQGTDRASLPHLMALLEDKDVIRSFMDEARGWTPDIPHMTAINARACVTAIQQARVRFKRTKGRSESTKMLKALREFRDNNLAHRLINIDEAEELLYGYISNLINATAGIMEPVRLGINGHHLSIKYPAREEAQKATAFGETLSKAMEIKGTSEGRLVLSSDHDSDGLTPYEEMLRSDRRHVPSSIPTGMPYALDKYHAVIEAFRLNPACPQDVRNQFDLARNLYLYSWFVYRFTSPAQGQAYAAVEAAIRERLSQEALPELEDADLKSLLDAAIDQGWLKDGGLVYDVEHGLVNDPDGTERVRQIAQIVSSFQNSFSHGEPTLLPPGASLMALEIGSSIINQLFPVVSTNT